MEPANQFEETSVSLRQKQDLLESISNNVFQKKQKMMIGPSKLVRRNAHVIFLNKLLFPKVYVLKNFKKVAIDFWNQQISSKFFENFLMKNIRFTKGILSLLHTQTAKKLTFKRSVIDVGTTIFFQNVKTVGKTRCFCEGILETNSLFSSIFILNFNCSIIDVEAKIFF